MLLNYLRMMEIWLRPNRRILLVSLIPVLGIGVLSLAVVALAESPLMKWGAGALLVLAAVMAAGLVQQLLKPRIVYRDGHVLFYLRSRQPIAVPVAVVEAFFLGQGPANLPAMIPQGDNPERTETVNLIARLSQKYPDWAKQDVKHALGNWCDSYVTIRGTWCETLNKETIRRLNRRLAEVSRAETAEETVATP